MRFFVLCFALLLLPFASALEIHVAPGGDDAHSGSVEAPLRTPAAAQARVRELLRGGLTEDIRVQFTYGPHLLSEPLRFSAEDGVPAGSSHTITYAGALGSQPLFSGGVPVTGWTRVEGDLWRAEVSSLKPFRDLYSQGERQTRARVPEVGQYLRVESVSEDVRTVTVAGLPQNYTGDWTGPGAELVVLQNWSISRVPIVKADGNVLTLAVPAGWIGHGPMTTTSPDKPCFIEHTRAALDAPQEWYLDTGAKQVFYRTDTDPNQMEIIAPRTEQLVVMHGTPEQPVRGIAFEGIQFAHSAWQLPDFGYMEIQAGHYGTTMQEKSHVLQHAIELLHTEGIAFRNCAVRQTGAGGIALGRRTRGNRIQRSYFEDIGGTGITIGWRGTGEMDGAGDGALAADWPDAALAPQDNVVEDCTVTRCGAISYGCVGIFDAFSKRTRIAHNLVYDMPYTGISVGYFWGVKPTSQEGAVIEANHIHDVMKLMADGGGIYTLGYQPGTVLRRNHIHDVHRSEFAHGGAPNNGIFFDEGSSALHVEGNLIYETSGEPIRFNQTDESKFTWKDNFLGAAPAPGQRPPMALVKAGPRAVWADRASKLPMIINEDNSHFFGSRSPEEMTLEGLHDFVDQYEDTAVTHLFLCPNSMKTSYDSDVWDAMWELGKQTPPQDEFAKKWLDNARLLHERGLDPYTVWIARSREKGISPWLSVRMNDIHNVDDTTHYIHGKFWVEHPEYWRVPRVEGGFFERALDYGHEEVRAHHMALVRELLERYDMDGIELDWMRFGWHFAPGKEAEGAEFLTEFMREVRALTDATAKRLGHPVLVSARVPTHPDAARGLGMDGVRWAKEGLVDWLVPSPFWATADFDIPLELWQEQLGEAAEKVTLAAGMEILLRAYPGGPQLETDLAGVRGFADSALARGAEAIYLFNYMDPEPMKGPAGQYRQLLREGLDRSEHAVLWAPRRYVATFRDTVPPGFSDNAQLPREIGEQPEIFRLYVGSRPEGVAAVLLGLTGEEDSAALSLSLNGVAVERSEAISQPENAPPASKWMSFTTAVEALKDGYNEITVENAGPSPQRVVWLELTIQPTFCNQ